MPKETTEGKGGISTIRAFVAIKLPEELKVKLGEVQDALKRGGRDVSWVKPESIHLTLKFLGDIEAARVDDISKALTEASAGVPPFTVTARGVGGFPNLKTPRVLWVGLEENAELARLAKNIDERLGDLGFERDDRPFHPHLTLARIKSPSEGRELGKKASELNIDINVDFKADFFVLFRSVLSPGGAEHTELKRLPLKG